MRQENGNTSTQETEPNAIGDLSSRNGFSRNGVSKANGNGTDSPGRHGSGKQEGYSSALSSYAMLAPPTAPTSDYFGHSREEVTRILIQSLMDLGYHRAAEQLQKDSEYTLEVPEVSEFRKAVLRGEWNKAERLLFSLDIDKDADTNVSVNYKSAL